MNNPNNPGDEAGPAPAYVLGHSDQEVERLNAQERLVGRITRQFLRDAGIVPGMRVLDVGSGAGDVAFLAADLVGNGGEVIGTDSAAAAVSAARPRAEARSLRNVSFRACDPTETAFERPFDAVVGRYVLMFNADPAAMLRKLAGHLRPGGVMVFHEVDWDGTRAFPPSPTYERCNHWIVETFRLLGTKTRMGAMLHAMERLGVATAAEVGIETLADRLRREVAAGGGVIVGRSEIGAWSRV